MTLKELSQLYYLKREIEDDQKRLAELKAQIPGYAGFAQSGMPSGNIKESQVERYAAEIADTEAIIAAKILQCTYERNRLERYISGIPDSLTRQIFTLRFVECLRWDQVSAKIGGNNSWKNLSNICYRYIKDQRNEI